MSIPEDVEHWPTVPGQLELFDDDTDDTDGEGPD